MSQRYPEFAEIAAPDSVEVKIALTKGGAVPHFDQNPYSPPLHESSGDVRSRRLTLRGYLRGFLLSIGMTVGGIAVAIGLILFLITVEPPKTPTAEVVVSTVLIICLVVAAGGLISAIVIGLLGFVRWFVGKSQRPDSLAD